MNLTPSFLQTSKVIVTTAMLFTRFQESHLLYRPGYHCFIPPFNHFSIQLSPWSPLWASHSLTSEQIQPCFYMSACWTCLHKMPITSLFCLNIFISLENLKYTNVIPWGNDPKEIINTAINVKVLKTFHWLYLQKRLFTQKTHVSVFYYCYCVLNVTNAICLPYT